MIMRGNTPRALGAFGAIAVLAVAALALPLLPGRAAVAQEPPAKLEGKDDPRAGEIRDMAKRLHAMREQLEKEQQALREKQMELEKHFYKLHEAMRRLGIGPAEAAPRDPRFDRQPGGPRPISQPVPRPPQPGGGDGRSRSEMERRLGELERILQQALQEIGNLRRELGQPGRRPGGGRPGDGPGVPGRAPGGDDQRSPRVPPQPGGPVPY